MQTAEHNFERIILLLFAVAFVVLVGVSVYAVSNALRNIDLSQGVEEDRKQLLDLKSLQVSLFEAETAQRAYALSGENVFLKEYDLARKEVTALFPRLVSTAASDEEREEIGILGDLVEDRLDHMEELINTRDNDGLAAAVSLVASREGKLLMDEVRREVNKIENIREKHLEAVHRKTINNANRLTLVFSVAAFLNLLLLITAFIILQRELRRESELVAKLQRTTEEITLSNRFNNSLQSCETREDAGRVIKHYMRLLFPSTSGLLYIMRSSRDILQVAAIWDRQGEDAGEQDFIQPQDCWGLRLGKTYMLSDSARDIPCQHVTDDPADGYICVPMMAQGEIVGLLHLQLSNETDREAVIALAENLGAQIATALANLALREALRMQNIRDPLTNLYNRRYLEETMEREMLLAQRNKTTLGIIMLDIDHFKSFNDNNGHQAGDELLKAFADYLGRHIRGGDIVCRYGGEEFVIILPGGSLEKTRERAEQLRRGIHDIHLDLRGRELPVVTASFGVAVYPDHADNWQDVLHIADVALYQAKQQGRDQVLVAELESS